MLPSLGTNASRTYESIRLYSVFCCLSALSAKFVDLCSRYTNFGKGLFNDISEHPCSLHVCKSLILQQLHLIHALLSDGHCYSCWQENDNHSATRSAWFLASALIPARVTWSQPETSNLHSSDRFASADTPLSVTRRQSPKFTLRNLGRPATTSTATSLSKGHFDRLRLVSADSLPSSRAPSSVIFLDSARLRWVRLDSPPRVRIPSRVSRMEPCKLKVRSAVNNPRARRPATVT
mmetsp:Transcript_1673/g.3452  ORF Transcript_1673/g.3452 Transcript_1673/m.3452 type:complete len:235 (-) Transcript_1673:2156-2860(-)